MRHITLPESEVRVVNTILKTGELSRTIIAELTGYSRAKITSVIGNLIDQGVLEEAGEGASTGGRKPRLLNFSRELGVVIGVDMGATSIEMAIADFNGQILERHEEETDVRRGPEPILLHVAEVVSEMLDRQGIPTEEVRGIGIGVPGPVEFATGLLIAPPIMPGWEAYPIRQKLQQVFTDAIVMVDNDVNIMALGELRKGAGVGVENFIFIKIGTGIGSGIVAHGEIYRGSSGCAGDIGHIRAAPDGPVCHCGNVGCLEAMAAGPAIAKAALEAAQEGRSPILSKYVEAHGGALTAIDVGRAAAEGDPVANEIIQHSGTLIGEVAAGLVNFFNPSLILIGGGVSHIGYQLLSSIRQGVLRRSLALSTRHLHIDYSTMGGEAGMTGAVALALEHVFVAE
jgi:glucokinase-like ROK family protein